MNIQSKNGIFAFDSDEQDIEQPKCLNTDSLKQKQIYAFDDCQQEQQQNSRAELKKQYYCHQQKKSEYKISSLNHQSEKNSDKSNEVYNQKEKCFLQKNKYMENSQIDNNQIEDNEEENNQKENNQMEGNAKFAGLQISQNKNKDLEYVEQRKAIKVTDLKKFLVTSLGDYKIKAVMKRISGGILNISTKFQISIQQNKKFLFSILRDGLSSYIISLSKQNISRKNKNYLGCLQSNMFGTQFKLYDIGFSPSQTRSLQHCRKQLATIKYEANKGPRKFQAIVSTNCSGLHAIQQEQDVILKNWNSKNRTNLSKLYSQTPQYDPEQGNYKLDFHGIVKKASVKNFILGGLQWKDSLVFGKIDQDTFIMEIKSPLSIIQAAAICVTSIHYKLQ